MIDADPTTVGRYRVSSLRHHARHTSASVTNAEEFGRSAVPLVVIPPGSRAVVIRIPMTAGRHGRVVEYSRTHS